MPKKTIKENKPLTLHQLADYNQKVLIPAMEGVFATKRDLKQELKQFATKEDLKKFATKNELKQETSMLRTEIRETRKELKQEIKKLAKTTNKTYNQVDKFIGYLKDREREEDIRHAQTDRRFENIEEHAGLEQPLFVSKA